VLDDLDPLCLMFVMGELLRIWGDLVIGSIDRRTMSGRWVVVDNWIGELSLGECDFRLERVDERRGSMLSPSMNRSLVGWIGMLLVLQLRTDGWLVGVGWLVDEWVDKQFVV
jgi:hypothetical protein